MEQYGVSLLEVFEGGGLVIFPLIVMVLILWYCLTYRLLVLKTNLTGDIRSLFKKLNFDNSLLGKNLQMIKTTNAPTEVLENSLIDARLKAQKYKIIIKTIVMIAPLLGLLGTVGGMIETFDSMAEMALFSQSGGIAGGISQALITTQVGLIVAVPGLIGGRLLDKKEKDFNHYLDQGLELIKIERGELNEI